MKIIVVISLHNQTYEVLSSLLQNLDRQLFGKRCSGELILVNKDCKDIQFQTRESPFLDNEITIETSQDEYSVDIDYFVISNTDDTSYLKNVAAKDPRGRVLLPEGETITITLPTIEPVIDSGDTSVTLYNDKASHCEPFLGHVKDTDKMALKIISIEETDELPKTAKLIVISGSVDGSIAAGPYIYIYDPEGNQIAFDAPNLSADNTFTFSLVAGDNDEPELLAEEPMNTSSNYRVSVSASPSFTNIDEVNMEFEYIVTPVPEEQETPTPAPVIPPTPAPAPTISPPLNVTALRNMVF